MMANAPEITLDLLFYGLMLFAVIASWLATRAQRRKTALFNYFFSELDRLRTPETTDDQWLLFIERCVGLVDLAHDDLDSQAFLPPPDEG